MSNIENDMLFNINNNINSKYFIDMLKRNYDKYHNLIYVGELIGELYTHSIINKDGYGFEAYMNRMEELYNQFHDKKVSPEYFEERKAFYIKALIARKLNIDLNAADSDQKINDYFLQEYVVNGYVSHSFPEAYKESIMANGLVASIDERGEKPANVTEIQDMFMSRGIVTPMGGYPLYGGSGIYYEHDFLRTFMHAVDAPEWFNWFTSSDHNNVYHKDVEVSPYILRNEEACDRNIMDLCLNAELSKEETEKVLTFYKENFRKFSSPKLNIALIPKKVVGKDSIEATDTKKLDAIQTILSVLHDKPRQYVEHDGNVCHETITPENFKVTTIPDASKYIYASDYYRESKEDLVSPEKNLDVITRIENDSTQRVVPSLIPKVEAAKQIILEKQEEKAKQLNQGQVKKRVLVKNDNISSGFASACITALITGFAGGVIATLLYNLLGK